MRYKCIFCDRKVETNDGSYSLSVHAEGLKKHQIVATIFEGDICGLCASYFGGSLVSLIRDKVIKDKRRKI